MSVRVYEEEEPVQSRWIMIFILLSLLAHALFLLAIILINRHIPGFNPNVPTPEPLVSMTLVQPPPPQRPFMPTDPQQNVTPKDTQIESNNDTRLQSKSPHTRQPDSLMPDLVSPRKHATDMHEAPKSTTQPKQAAPPTPPAPKQPPEKPTPPQPTPEKPQPQPTQAKPVEAKPSKTPPPPKPQPDVDSNGLPVLPPIAAATLAPQTTTQQYPTQQPAPPPTVPAESMDMQGKAGISGAPSPEAMPTDFGKYKALVYQAVGTRWYPKVNNQFQLLGVGSVRIQYTIYSDGTVTTKVLDGGSSSMQMLLSISLNSITEAAPFPPFTPGMLKQLKGEDSYTDEFTFSVYGN